MSRGRLSVLIPSEDYFLKDKKISDRIYAYILLKGERIENEIYIDKKIRNGYKELGINYRTFYKRLDYLASVGYLEDLGSKYKIKTDMIEKRRFVYRDIIQKLYLTNKDNIIKVYVYLSSLYSQYGKNAWFTYNSLLAAIGYSYERNTRNQSTIESILIELSKLNIIKYCRTYKPGDKYMIKFQLLYVKVR